MKRIMDEYTIRLKTRKSHGYANRTMALVKYANGDFRIKMGLRLVSAHSLKYVAEAKFARHKADHQREGIIV